MLNDLKASVAGFTFNDYLRHLKSVEEACADGQPLRVAVLRSYTVEPIEPVLKFRLLLEGFRPTFWFGGYNQYAQEILDAGGALYESRPNLILLLIRLEEVMPAFVDAFASRPSSEWERLIASKVLELDALVERLETTLSATVLVQNMTLAGHAYFGVFDPQRPDGQAQLVEYFNRELAAALTRRMGVFLWDFDAFVHRTGYETLYDAKGWYVSRSPFKQGSYPAIVSDLFRYVRSALGRITKCIVLDLDNTLWGGVVGEDGFEGIKLGHAYPGNCYRDFQRELLRLYDRGILLAINSKNNEEDALRILDEHPDMILRRHHFAGMRINWNNKASNLRELARELNIGLDAMIFLDDSAVECDLIRREYPKCEVVLLPEKPYLLPAVPRGLPGIENIGLTSEDRRKGEMYRLQAARKEEEERFSNLDDFLRSLDVEVSIDTATPYSIPRIAQLTQKTNQMNMTTRRYTEAEIRAFAQDSNSSVFSVASKDRFGDNGIIGVIVLKFSSAECVIDTFLLSCRVIGRGIEQAMIAFIADVCRARGAQSLIGEFLPTAKNQPAAGFYERAGLAPAGDGCFRADLRHVALSWPDHVRLDAIHGPAVDRA